MAARQHPDSLFDQFQSRVSHRASSADRGASCASCEPRRHATLSRLTSALAALLSRSERRQLAESRPLARLTFAVALLTAGVGLLVPATFGVVAFTQPASGADQVANLKDTLEKGLKARRPEEFRFIARVVKLVEEDRLPLPLVLGTFKWARSRSSHVPYPYFKRGLEERAARIGVRV
ncbi:MAG: hypothetical protein J5I93_02270 [Pirellulaceae bacterium]|nr:hypothetical protein [Pirellulaceae bacterium]